MDLISCSLACEHCEGYCLSLGTNGKGEYLKCCDCTNTFVAPVTSVKLIIKAVYVSKVSCKSVQQQDMSLIVFVSLTLVRQSVLKLGGFKQPANAVDETSFHCSTCAYRTRSVCVSEPFSKTALLQISSNKSEAVTLFLINGGDTANFNLDILLWLVCKCTNPSSQSWK